jgi:hypothetical protein
MSPTQVSGLTLISELVKNQDKSLIVMDEEGNFHFSGHIHNVKDVIRSLNALKNQPRYMELVNAESAEIESLFEEVFHHAEFTGRSGTFFAYEGLGSIYWHMVSKHMLAVQETIIRTRGESSTSALMEKYADIRKGLSFNKSPDVYGAFPTDPYSHTPKDQGSRQPGMTGSVKEEILSRRIELGAFIENGRLAFDFLFLDEKEFLIDSNLFTYFDITGKKQKLELKAGSIAYTIFQVPVILQTSNKNLVTLYFTDESSQQVEGHVLDYINSRHIFQRDGLVHHLVVSIISGM